VTVDEEKYVHFVESIDALNRAWRLLKEVQAAKQSSLIVSAAFKFALIEYSKPYRRTVGVLGKYKLGDEYVPVSQIDLHKRLLDWRDKVLAHSDLTLKEASVTAAMYSHGPIVTVLSNTIDAAQDIQNIETIITLIEQTLDRMYAELPRFKMLLASKP
jgi:hypothetical protein